jgi:hypothetical protein
MSTRQPLLSLIDVQASDFQQKVHILACKDSVSNTTCEIHSSAYKHFA